MPPPCSMDHFEDRAPRVVGVWRGPDVRIVGTYAHQSISIAFSVDSCLPDWKKIQPERMLWTNYQRVKSMHVLRFPVVSELTGLPRSTLYLYMKNGQFPKPVKLGVRSVGWIKEEVDEWLQLRKSLRIY